MKLMPFCFLTFILIYSTNSFAQNNIIVYYKPVQSGLVGKTLISYRNGQALFGTVLPGIKLQDEASASQDQDEFERQFTIGLAKIFAGKSIKTVKVRAVSVSVSNITNDVSSLPNGAQIVMSGLKADSVFITIEKDNSYKLTPSELLDQIKPFAAVSDASALNVIKLIDSIGYSVKKSLRIVVTNPKVYYAMIVGQKINYFASGAYYELASKDNPLVLTADNSVSQPVRPKFSNEYEKTGFPVDIRLYMQTDSEGKLQLYANATKAEGGTADTRISNVDASHWRGINILVTTHSVPGKLSKQYFMDISAKLGSDGHSIIVDNAVIRYPEIILQAVKEGKLNK